MEFCKDIEEKENIGKEPLHTEKPETPRSTRISLMQFVKVFCIVILIFVGFYMVSNKLYEHHNGHLLAEIQNLEHKIDSLTGTIHFLEDSIYNIAYMQFDKDLFLFKLALIHVESNFDPRAVNRWSQASGLYQIMPRGGFLQEANRLQNEHHFTDSCKFDPLRSTMIYEIVNQHRNPTRSMARSIHLHNPTAGPWYGERVMKSYNMFQQIAWTL